MAINCAISRRPIKKFSDGSAIELQATLAAFENNCESEFLNDRERLQELKHYFDGAAAEFVEAQAMKTNSADGLKEAIGGLRRIYGHTKDSSVDLYYDLLQGGPLEKTDTGELQRFFTKLEIAYSVAIATNVADDFTKPQSLRKLLEVKMPFLHEKFSAAAIAAERQGSQVDFETLRDLFSIHIDTTRFMDQSSSSMRKARIAAAAAEPPPPEVSYATAVSKSPAKEPIEDRCGFCQGYHRTEICNTIAKLNGEQRYRKLVEAGLCTRCTGKHSYLRCNIQPTCILCHGSHLTMNHCDENPRRKQTPRQTGNDAGAAAISTSASVTVETDEGSPV